MNIELNMKSCEKCGVYLNIEKVEKRLLSLKFKERYCGDRESYSYVSIYGFSCPICKELHIKEDFYSHELDYAKEDDDSVNNSLSEEEYIKKKLNITDRCCLKFYGEESE